MSVVSVFECGVGVIQIEGGMLVRQCVTRSIVQEGVAG